VLRAIATAQTNGLPDVPASLFGERSTYSTKHTESDIESEEDIENSDEEDEFEEIPPPDREIPVIDKGKSRTEGFNGLPLETLEVLIKMCFVDKAVPATASLAAQKLRVGLRKKVGRETVVTKIFVSLLHDNEIDYLLRMRRLRDVDDLVDYLNSGE
jgi:hypothetical protein